MARRVLIIDDHPVVLFGLGFLFERADRFSVCGEAADAATARTRAKALQPDAIVMDLVLGGRDGLDLVRDLVGLAPAARILVYSSQNPRQFARRCLQAGAHGFVSKAEGLPVVADALGVLLRGQAYVGPGPSDDGADVPRRPSPGGGLDALSNRELEVLRLLGEGRSAREIAAAFGLSVKTVGTYRERLKIKLAVETTRDLEAAGRDYVAGRLTS